jgi:hypothetical protein
VATPGYFHEFTIESSFGRFEAMGRTQLAVRLQEIDALASLQAVSKSDVFLEAAGQSLVNVGKGAVSAATDPVGTAKGIGGGIKRMGVNLGRRSKRAVDSATSDEQEAEDAAGQGSAAGNAAKSLLGVNSAMRRWAKKVGVDPYTTNPVLSEALEGIAKVDVSGSIATKVVVPIPAVVSTTATVGDLVWGLDPEELRKRNEQRARELAVPDEVAKALFASRVYTLTLQTRLIAALHAVRAAGSADYVASAVEARREREALFFVESAEMLQRAHATGPVTAILDDTEVVVAARGGRALMLLPLDYVSSSARTREVLAEVNERAKKELGAGRVDVWLTGRASDRMRKEIAAVGWTLEEQQPLR